MIKRILIAITIALIVCGTLVSCYAYVPETDGNPEANTEPTAQPDFGLFIIIEKGSIKKSDIYQYIMYDPSTMVMYSYLDGYSGGGPTVMYNADGSLRLYSPSSEIE